MSHEISCHVSAMLPALIGSRYSYFLVSIGPTRRRRWSNRSGVILKYISFTSVWYSPSRNRLRNMSRIQHFFLYFCFLFREGKKEGANACSLLPPFVLLTAQIKFTRSICFQPRPQSVCSAITYVKRKRSVKQFYPIVETVYVRFIYARKTHVKFYASVEIHLNCFYTYLTIRWSVPIRHFIISPPVSTRDVMGKFCGPYFTIRPAAKLQQVSFLARPINLRDIVNILLISFFLVCVVSYGSSFFSPLGYKSTGKKLGL